MARKILLDTNDQLISDCTGAMHAAMQAQPRTHQAISGGCTQQARQARAEADGACGLVMGSQAVQGGRARAGSRVVGSHKAILSRCHKGGRRTGRPGQRLQIRPHAPGQRLRLCCPHIRLRSRIQPLS